MTKPNEGTTSGRSPAEATAISAVQSDEHGTNSHTPKDEWKPNPNQRKPFEPAHTLSLIHGAESERTIEARAAEVRVQLFEIAPWLDQAAFVPAVARFLRAEARELLIHEHIVKVSAEEGTGAVPQRLWESATACANASMKASALLGLDPQSYARLRATTGHAASTEASLVDRLADAAKAHSVNPTTHRPTGGDVEVEPESGESS